jgi:hypothetical protein
MYAVKRVLVIPKGAIVEIDHLSDCRWGPGWRSDGSGLEVPRCPVRYAGTSGWLNAMLLSFDGLAFTSAH